MVMFLTALVFVYLVVAIHFSIDSLQRRLDNRCKTVARGYKPASRFRIAYRVLRVGLLWPMSLYHRHKTREYFRRLRREGNV